MHLTETTILLSYVIITTTNKQICKCISSWHACKTATQLSQVERPMFGLSQGAIVADLLAFVQLPSRNIL